MRFSDLLKKALGSKVMWLLVFLSVVALVYLNQFTLVLKDPVLIDPAGKRTGISLPYQQPMPAEAEYTVAGKFYYHRVLSANVVHIIPDDLVLSIRINQRDIPPDEVDSTLNNCHKGFHFNFGRYLRHGVNDIEIRVKNEDGPSGIIFNNSFYDPKTFIAYAVLLITIFTIVYHVLACFIPNKVLIYILLGGFLIRLAYFVVTPYYVRDHDLEGHLEYIHYVLKHWTRPPEDFGWETRQGPLYYFLAAFVYQAANFLGINNTYNLLRLLQFFSLLLTMGFLMASLLILNNIMSRLPCFSNQNNNNNNKPAAAAQGVSLPETREIKIKNRLTALMFGLVTFWPSGIMHSVRIGNDSLYYCLYGWGLLFLVKWYYDNRDEHLYSNSLFMALCLITKANALILYGVSGMVVLWKLIRDRAWKRYLPKLALLLLLFGAGVLVIFGNTLEIKMKGSTEHFMVGGAHLLGGQYVGNKLINYIWFDLPVFVTVPYADPWGDAGGRQYFWNYLLKTCLIGEFGFDTPFHRSLVVLMSIMLLGMIIYAGIGLIIILFKEFKEHIILVVNFILFLMAAILIRVSLPASCINDFRYILPVLISGCFFYGYTVAICRRKGWILLEIAGYSLAILFMTASNLFIMGLQF